MTNDWVACHYLEELPEKFVAKPWKRNLVNYGIHNFSTNARGKIHAFALLNNMKVPEFFQVLCEWWLPDNAYINYKTNTRNCKRNPTRG